MKVRTCTAGSLELFSGATDIPRAYTYHKTIGQLRGTMLGDYVYVALEYSIL